MELKDLRQDTLVEHPELGVGKIVGVEPEQNQAVISFRSEPEFRMPIKDAISLLETRPPAGLSAYLYADPEEVLSWVNAGQLRLVGATLADLGGSGKAGPLKTRLSTVSKNVEWNAWWEDIRPFVREDTFHFSIAKSNVMSLLSQVSDISVEALPVKSHLPTGELEPSGNLRVGSSRDWPQWVQWLWAKEDAPLPGTTPPDGLVALVETLPEEIIEAAMNRLMTGVSEALATPRLTPKAKDQWLELLTKAHQRRQGCLAPEYTEATARRTPKLLAQLLDALQEQAGIPALLSKAGALTSTDHRWRQDFAAGLWDAFKGNVATAETLLRRLASSLDDKQQVALWGDLLTAAFKGAYYPGRLSDLNRVMSWLKADLRATAIQRLILQAALHDRVAEGDVASFVAESRYAGKSDGPEKLNALVTAGLLLQEGTDNFIAEVSDAYTVALNQNGEWGIPLVDALVDASRDHIASLNQQWQDKLDKREEAFTEKRKGWQDEISHQTSQLRALRAEMVSGRKKSNLEVRSGMLLRIGDILQGTYRADKSTESRLNDVMERLPMVLNDGDAELFGTVGSIVEYDGKLHHTTVAIPRGGLVRIAAPGIIVKDTSLDDNDPVLLKATVIPETQEA